MSERKKHIIIGALLIVCFFILLGLVAGIAYLPGFVGELGTMCLSMLTSPFIMETTIAFLAITMLFAINGWRRNKDGDDYLELDENGTPVKKP